MLTRIPSQGTHFRGMESVLSVFLISFTNVSLYDSGKTRPMISPAYRLAREYAESTDNINCLTFLQNSCDVRASTTSARYNSAACRLSVITCSSPLKYGV